MTEPSGVYDSSKEIVDLKARVEQLDKSLKPKVFECKTSNELICNLKAENSKLMHECSRADIKIKELNRKVMSLTDDIKDNEVIISTTNALISLKNDTIDNLKKELFQKNTELQQYKEKELRYKEQISKFKELFENIQNM